jgi:hypothetical protein
VLRRGVLPGRWPGLHRRPGTREELVSGQAERHQQRQAGQRDAGHHGPVRPPPGRPGQRDQLVDAGGRDRARGPVGGVELLDQRPGISRDDLGDAADMPPGVEVAAAHRVVVTLDAPDDRLPDTGPLADLGDGEAGLAARFRQGFADAHATPIPRSRLISPGISASSPETDGIIWARWGR